ncbi:MAG TPA: sigma-70 family RNA polymerase sigma factor [Allosphingosinicella sp.]|nr:sigma-70 family RNA polymerase sigma factor [Allosphingosinicella sp.]
MAIEEKNETVSDALESLLGDWRRKGSLSSADITRVAIKRRLSPEQLHAVLVGLKNQGVVAEDDAPNDAASGIDTAPRRRERKTGSLTREEEKSLANSIRLGRDLQLAPAASPEELALIRFGDAAHDEFIVRNLRLVHWVAQKWRGNLDYDDLVQEGVKGLIKAVEMFDPDLGYKFATYATWWIEQAIRRGIDDTANEIRMPVHRLEQVRRLRRMARRLRVETGCDPSTTKLAAALDWSLEKTAFIADLATYRTVEMDAPLGPHSDLSIRDGLADSRLPSPEEEAMHEALTSLLDKMIGDLPPRTQYIIRQRFGIGTGQERTLEDIGREHGLTRERIRQIEAKGLTKLRHPGRAKALRTFWEH